MSMQQKIKSNAIFIGYLTFKYYNIHYSISILTYINFNITVHCIYVQPMARLC